MNQTQLTDLLLTSFPAVSIQSAYGEATFYYNPHERLKRGTYFCTIKENDGPHDRASALSRPGVWRFNFGLPQNRYTELFGPRPARPSKGGVIEGTWIFTQEDCLMPHPVYGWMGWVCILNPTQATINIIWPDIERAHQNSLEAFEKRLAKET